MGTFLTSYKGTFSQSRDTILQKIVARSCGWMLQEQVLKEEAIRCEWQESRVSGGILRLSC